MFSSFRSFIRCPVFVLQCLFFCILFNVFIVIVAIVTVVLFVVVVVVVVVFQ